MYLQALLALDQLHRVAPPKRKQYYLLNHLEPEPDLSSTKGVKTPVSKDTSIDAATFNNNGFWLPIVWSCSRREAPPCPLPSRYGNSDWSEMEVHAMDILFLPGSLLSFPPFLDSTYRFPLSAEETWIRLSKGYLEDTCWGKEKRLTYKIAWTYLDFAVHCSIDVCTSNFWGSDWSCFLKE